MSYPMLLKFLQLETPEQTESIIKQVFWIYLIMAATVAYNIGLSVWIITQTGIDEIGTIPGTSFTSFSGLAVSGVLDLLVLLVAAFVFRLKKSFSAATVILLIAIVRLYNAVDVYLIQEVATPRMTKFILPALYILAALIGMAATWRWKRLHA